MPSPTIHPPSASLLGQPNEVLHMIVGHLPNPYDYTSLVKYVDEKGITRDVSQYLVLAHVCKRLRTVVQEADLWHDPEFCFSNLLAEREEREEGEGGGGEGEGEGDGDGDGDFPVEMDTKAIRIAGLVKTLFDDEGWVNCFKKKKSWKFVTVESLIAVVISASWFLESVRLSWEDECEVMPSLMSLSRCRRLKQLETTFTPRTPPPRRSELDLALIQGYLPNLRKLSIGIDTSYRGSLQGLRKLTHLSLQYCNGRSIPDAGQLLPVASRSTLRSLTIDHVDPSASLDLFSNLTCLSIRRITAQVLTTLRNLANVKLQTLRIEVWLCEEIESLMDLEESQCLTKLKQLHLRCLCFEVVEAAVGMPRISRALMRVFGISHFQTVEHLKLQGGFDLTWCPTLASLKRLKCFQLGITKHAIGCTFGEQFYELGAKSPEEQNLERRFFANVTDTKGLTAMLQTEFKFVPKLKIWYTGYPNQGRYDFEMYFPMEYWSCLCGKD